MTKITHLHDNYQMNTCILSEFQITFKGRMSTKSFEGSTDVSLHTFSSLPFYFVGSLVANFLRFLTREPSLICDTVLLRIFWTFTSNSYSNNICAKFQLKDFRAKFDYLKKVHPGQFSKIHFVIHFHPSHY